METGRHVYPVQEQSKCTFRCDCEFTLFAETPKGPMCILGPVNSSDRMCVFTVPIGCTSVRVRTSQKALHQLSEVPKAGKEVLDPTPVEAPLGFGQPPTLQETIERLVSSKWNEIAARNKFETLEEADDLEPEDADDISDVMSKYEISEMNEDLPFPGVDKFAQGLPPEGADPEQPAPQPDIESGDNQEQATETA